MEIVLFKEHGKMSKEATQLSPSPYFLDEAENATGGQWLKAHAAAGDNRAQWLYSN